MILLKMYKENPPMESKTGKRCSTHLPLKQELHALILMILRNYATRQQPLTPNEIRHHLIAEAMLLPGGDMDSFNVTAVTIRNNLDSMFSFCLDNPKEFASLYFGYLHRLHLSTDTVTRTFIEDQDCFQDNGNRTTFYYFKPLFTSSELLVLQSCVETNPYLSGNDARLLNHKISTLSPQFFKNQGTDVRLSLPATESQRLNAEAADLLFTLSALIYHMNREEQLVITYGKYDIHGNLTARKLDEAGNPKAQIIDPVSVFWANGFCYVVAHTPKSKTPDDVISYRVDRILSIEASCDKNGHPVLMAEAVQKYRRTFSSLDYIKNHPVMYSGSRTDITMLVLDSDYFPVSNLLFDTFGREIVIRPLPEAEANTYLHATCSELAQKGERWYHVRLKHSIPGTILWAKQHIDIARIISPEAAVTALKEAVQKGLDRY